jgi:CelD/BcsL family acetyltransferase involved in cellulose biosynthesis
VITSALTNESRAQSLTVQLLNDTHSLQSLSVEWNDLYERCTEATPFQRPAWLLRWIDAFSPSDLLMLTVRDDEGLVGVAPLLIYRRDGKRILALAGGGISDYLGLLGERNREAEVVQAVLEWADACSNWDRLDLTDIPADSALLRLPVFQSYTYEHDSVSVLHLPANRGELLHAFSRRHRANLRNAASRLQRAGGGQVETATPETLSEFLDDLFRLHTTRWSQSGQPGVLQDEKTRTLHRSSAPALLSQGVLKIHRLRVGQRTIAIISSLWDRGTVFCYMQGFDPAYASLSPGTQLIFAVIEEAQKLGFRKFDFLRGQEAYKQHWRAEPRPTYRITINKAQLAERLKRSQGPRQV